LSIFKKLFGRREKPPEESEEDYLEELATEEPYEVEDLDELEEEQLIYIKPYVLHSTADIEAVTEELSAGNIVLLDISPLLEKDPFELKSAIEQLKGVARSIGGDIASISETKVILTPSFVKILKRRGET